MLQRRSRLSSTSPRPIRHRGPSPAIHLRKGGRSRIVERGRSRGDTVGPTSTSLFEHLSSIFHRRPLKREKAVRVFARGQFLVLDSAATEEASKIMGALSPIGEPIHALDVLISGIAVANCADEISHLGQGLSDHRESCKHQRHDHLKNTTPIITLAAKNPQTILPSPLTEQPPHCPTRHEWNRNQRSNYKTTTSFSGIIDRSERGDATTWFSSERIFYQGGFPGCCVIGGGIS